MKIRKATPQDLREMTHNWVEWLGSSNKSSSVIQEEKPIHKPPVVEKKRTVRIPRLGGIGERGILIAYGGMDVERKIRWLKNMMSEIAVDLTYSSCAEVDFLDLYGGVDIERLEPPAKHQGITVEYLCWVEETRIAEVKQSLRYAIDGFCDAEVSLGEKGSRGVLVAYGDGVLEEKVDWLGDLLDSANLIAEDADFVLDEAEFLREYCNISIEYTTHHSCMPGWDGSFCRIWVKPSEKRVFIRQIKEGIARLLQERPPLEKEDR